MRHLPYGFGGGAAGPGPLGVRDGGRRIERFTAGDTGAPVELGTAVTVGGGAGESSPIDITVGFEGSTGSGAGGGGGGAVKAGTGFFGSSVDTAKTAAAVSATMMAPRSTIPKRSAKLDFFGVKSTGAMLRIGPRPLATSFAV